MKLDTRPADVQAVLHRFTGNPDEILQWGFRLAWTLMRNGRLFVSGGDDASDIGFARQVRANAVPGDVVLLLSTSGRSPDAIAAAEAAREMGAEAWALTGKLPNPLASECKYVIAVASDDSQVVQEVHRLLVHLLCESVDELLPTMQTE